MAGHRFLSWLRLGAGAVSGGAPTLPLRVRVGGADQSIELRVYGPGDVAGLDGTVIARREPTAAATGVSPHHFAFVELTAADLPWRFSPAAAAGAPVVPWLALVVVPAATPFGPRPGAALPVLSVARRELPDPATLWAWAHVQVSEPAGGVTGSVAELVRTQPRLAIARVIAARHLQPGQRYRACLVPVFEAGRRAGLGLPAEGAGFGWQPGDGSVDLPVYESWEFATGDGADFETIARRLKARDATALFAPLALDVRAAAGRASPIGASMFGLLRPPGATGDLADGAAVAAGLATRLADGDTAIGAPIYGALASGRSDPRPEAQAGDWLSELNLDPRRRLLAAAGAAAVRADQEALVAEVRAMAGQIDRANQTLRGGQLAQLATARLIERHVASRPPVRMLAMLQQSVPATAGATAELQSPAFRRLARPAGPTRGRGTAGLAWTRIGRDLQLAVATPRPRGMVTVAQIHAALTAEPATPIIAVHPATLTMATQPPPPTEPPATTPPRGRRPMTPLERTPLERTPLGHTPLERIPLERTPLGRPPVERPPVERPPVERPPVERPPVEPPPAERGGLAWHVVADAGLRAAIIDALQVRAVRPRAMITEHPPRAADVPALAAAALAAIAPARIAARVAGRLEGAVADTAALAELQVAPTLLHPLADRVAALAAERFLPGVDALPPDTVAVLEVDPGAVEAVLAGANHELARELAWRGIPADPRATLLAQLWPRLDGGAAADIAPIAGWTGRLGSHTTSAPAVFVVRSELIRRFPDALILCARAVLDPQVGRRPGDEVLLPMFAGRCGDDIAYVGFDRPVAQLRDGAGWYLVIQERPGRMRFGLDATRRLGATSWLDLAWTDVTADPYLRLAAAPAGFPQAPRWAGSGASMAAITERPAVRVAIHLDELV